MFNMAKKQLSRVLAGLLAVVMAVCAVPVELYTTAFAEGIEQFIVKVMNGENLVTAGTEITLTKKDDKTKTDTQSTEKGKAVFKNFVEEGATYIVSVKSIYGYKDVADYELTVNKGDTEAAVSLTALEKAVISGIVTKEDGSAYNNATVGLFYNGKIVKQAKPDSKGRYSFDAYKGINYTLKLSTGDAYKNDSVEITNVSENIVHDFIVVAKKYSITVIDNPGDTEVVADNISYNGNRTITVGNKDGYRIESILVNSKKLSDEETPEYKGAKSYKIELKNITSNYTIRVKYYRQSYKIEFTVGENGEVKYSDGNFENTVAGFVSFDKSFDESTDSKNPTKVTVKATPNEGYRVASVIIDGGKPDNFTTNNKAYEKEFVMTKDHKFEVTFAVNAYKVSLAKDDKTVRYIIEDENGNKKKVTAIGGVEHGSDVTAIITPPAGKNIEAIKAKDATAEDPATAKDAATAEYILNEDGKTYTLTLGKVTSNIVLSVEYSDVKNAKVTFTEGYTAVDVDENTVKYVYESGTDSASITSPKGFDIMRVNGKLIKADADKDYTVYTLDSDVLIETIKTIELYSSTEKKWYSVNLEKNIQITFDDRAPLFGDDTGRYVETDGELKITKSWTKWEDNFKITIKGTVSDNTDSTDNTDKYYGTKFVYWSKTKAEDKKISLSVLKSKFTEIELSNNEFSFEDKEITKESVEGGSITYYLYAVDRSGNISEEKEITAYVDAEKPTIDSITFSTEDKNIVDNLINFLSFGIFCKQEVYVTVSASDNKSGVTNIQLRIKDSKGEEKTFTAETQNGNAVFALTSKEVGNGYYLSAKANDLVGNESDEKTPDTKSNFIMINDSKPAVSFSTPTATYTDIDKDKNIKLWYKTNGVKVGIKVNDVEKDKINCGINKISIKLNGKELEKNSDDNDYSDKLITEKNFSVVVNDEGENTIEVKVINNLGVEKTFTQKIYIDTKTPEINKFEYVRINNDPFSKILNFLSFGNFFNEQVKVNITARDSGSGLAEMALTVGEKTYISKNATKGVYTFTLPVDEALDTKTGKLLIAGAVSAKVTDNVGHDSEAAPTEKNSNIQSDNLMIETVKPEAEITVSGSNKHGDWYSSDVKFTVKASDSDSGVRSVIASINGKELLNKDFSKSKEKTENTDTFTISTKDAKIKSDGSYELKVTVTDNAGNVSEEYIKKVYKDITAPVITGFAFNAKDYKEGREDTASVEATDYGFYFKKDTKVTISAKDDSHSSGIKSITYYTVDVDNNKSAEKTVTVKDNKISFTVKADFKGQIYAKATDNVKNITKDFVTPNSTIVESPSKHSEENHIAFSKDKASYKTENKTDLYSKNVPVAITVTDTYSGIREIEWSVTAPYDTNNNQSGKVTVDNNRKMSGDSGWKQDKTEANLVYVMKKTVTVSNNSNDIVVKVKMTDRAGNTSEKSIKLSIDKTAPVIAVSYDNNSADATYTDIYKADRTATVTIAERNFNASDVKVKMTNTDGAVPALSEWTKHADNNNPDATYYTAQVRYSADGDYTFDISYADRAKNSAAKFAQHKFTIDKTVPTVSVSYDNASAINGNYYKADRVATIAITEHNFDSSRVRIIGTATDNGKVVTFPAASGWSDNGDVHTATVSYSADAKYSFDIEFTDKAGNVMANYAADEFYVDKTAPTLTISGVADKSANNGTVAPVITVSDTNFSSKSVTYKLTGVNNGTVTYEASVTDTTNGQKITFADFEKAQKVDDIYTLTVASTDMAGNETTASITFSVNRFGSVYDISAMDKTNGKYLKSEDDVVITETNVDALNKSDTKVKLIKNGTPTDLEEGKDYSVEETGGNGKWKQYKYKINKSLFTDDGKYSVSVYTVDAAGNVNENIAENKKAEISFGVDKTNPVVVPIDFESGSQYPVTTKTVSVEIKDNLVLDNVKIYLNDTEVKYNNEGESYTFDIPEKNEKQNVKIIATDAAGNELALTVDNFLVTSNVFVRWFNNTPLFIGSIAGIVVIIGAVIVLVVLKRRKKESE